MFITVYFCNYSPRHCNGGTHKAISRKKKMDIINAFKPEWKDLYRLANKIIKTIRFAFVLKLLVCRHLVIADETKFISFFC